MSVAWADLADWQQLLGMSDLFVEVRSYCSCVSICVRQVSQSNEIGWRSHWVSYVWPGVLPHFIPLPFLHVLCPLQHLNNLFAPHRPHESLQAETLSSYPLNSCSKDHLSLVIPFISQAQVPTTSSSCHTLSRSNPSSHRGRSALRAFSSASAQTLPFTWTGSQLGRHRHIPRARIACLGSQSPSRLAGRCPPVVF